MAPPKAIDTPELELPTTKEEATKLIAMSGVELEEPIPLLFFNNPKFSDSKILDYEFPHFKTDFPPWSEENVHLQAYYPSALVWWHKFEVSTTHLTYANSDNLYRAIWIAQIAFKKAYSNMATASPHRQKQFVRNTTSKSRRTLVSPSFL